MNEKIPAFLGLMRKAGVLKFGFDAVCISAEQKKSCLIVVTNDISEKTLKELRYACRNAEVKILQIPYTMETIGKVIGKNVKILSVENKDFADGLKKLTETLEEESGI